MEMFNKCHTDFVRACNIMCLQGNTEDAAQGQGSSKPIHQPALFCFFPLSKKQQQQQIGQSSTTLLNNHNCSSSTDVGENIDLSLKL